MHDVERYQLTFEIKTALPTATTEKAIAIDKQNMPINMPPTDPLN